MYVYIYIYSLGYGDKYLHLDKYFKYAYVFALLDKDLPNPFKANVPIISIWRQQKLHLLFSGFLRWCRMGAFARNGSFTDMVHGM